MGERLSRAERLHRRLDYQRCYREGRRRHGALVILYHVPNELDHPRIGITASRKVGKAVVRHRLKRRVKEIYRRWSRREAMPAVDFVVHLKPTAAESDFRGLRGDLLRLLRGLVKGETEGSVARDGRSRKAGKGRSREGSSEEVPRDE